MKAPPPLSSNSPWEPPAHWLETLQYIEEAGAQTRAILLNNRAAILADRRLRVALTSLDDSLDELEGETFALPHRSSPAFNVRLRQRWARIALMLDRLESVARLLSEPGLAKHFPAELPGLLAEICSQGAALRTEINQARLLDGIEPADAQEQGNGRALPESIDRSLKTLAAQASPYDVTTQTDIYELAFQTARLARLDGGFDAYASAPRVLPDDVEAGVDLAAATASLNWFSRLRFRRQLKKVMRAAYLEGELNALSRINAGDGDAQRLNS